jgi:hypothetical protein
MTPTKGSLILPSQEILRCAQDDKQPIAAENIQRAIG